MMDEQRKRDAVGARQSKISYEISSSYQPHKPTPVSQSRPTTSFKPKYRIVYTCIKYLLEPLEVA